jgi:ribonuclease E
MRDVKNKLKVEKCMRNCLKEDKARTKVGRISKFGLMEMSRQRIRQSIELERFEVCENCQGKGLVMPVDAQGLGFLRKIRLKASGKDIKDIKAIVPEKVAYYLLNRKREDILNIEARHNISINIEGDIRMFPGKSNILCEK